MTDQTKKESNAVKMQKLRHAVDRLRNIRSTSEPLLHKKSWIARLKERLGLGKDEDTD